MLVLAQLFEQAMLLAKNKAAWSVTITPIVCLKIDFVKTYNVEQNGNNNALDSEGVQTSMAPISSKGNPGLYEEKPLL